MWYRAIIFAACTTLSLSGFAQSVKPGSLPSSKLYSSTSPLNQKISVDAAIDPDSQQYIDALNLAVQSFVIQVKQYSSPVYIADANTPRHDIMLTCGSTWEIGVDVLKDVPIPDYAEPANDIDGADNPVPAAGCGENSAQDNNMVVIDMASRCEYDFWQARLNNGQWLASWGNGISIDSIGVYAKGLSTRGSGFAFLAGVIWPYELSANTISHALLFSLPNEMVSGGGPVPPATETDGESSYAYALPEGARLRLDPSLDLNSLGLTPAELTIARAMQEYGMFLTDRGGGPVIALYAVDPVSVSGNPYDGLLPDVNYVSLSGIPLDRLQVMQLPSQDPDFQQKLALPDDPCRTFMTQEQATSINTSRKLLPLLFSDDD